MPQISTQEFERLPLRVHDFLAGVPLHDVWAIDLPRVRSGITLDEFSRIAGARLCTPPPVVRALLNIRTAHAAALSALVETANAYRFYFGIYVRSVSRFTPIYMALIDPFRKLIVYPALLRSVRAKWNKAFGTA